MQELMDDLADEIRIARLAFPYDNRLPTERLESFAAQLIPLDVAR
jgi:hypothetical protein